MIVVAADTIAKQCMVHVGQDQDMREGCSTCIRERQCNCVYTATSKLGSVSVPTDMQHCKEVSLDREVIIPLNMAKLQYLWSDEYLYNVSQLTAEDIDNIPEVKFQIDGTKFEHALNRHYQLLMSLKTATEKAKKNIKIYPIKQLPESMWDLGTWSDFFMLGNSLTIVALGLAVLSLALGIHTAKQTYQIHTLMAVLAVSAKPIRAEETTTNKNFSDLMEQLAPFEKYIYGWLFTWALCQLLLLASWLMYKCWKALPKLSVPNCISLPKLDPPWSVSLH